MQEDQRLTPFPRILEMKEVGGDYPPAYSPYYDDEAIDGRRSIRQYVDVIYKRLPLILALTIVVTAAAAFYMYQQQSEYQATAELLIEPRKPKVTSKDSININFGNDVNYYNTQLKLLQSPTLMKEVVIELGLYKNPDLFSDENRGMGSTIRSIFSSEKGTEEKANILPTISPTEDNAVPAKIILSDDERKRAERYASRLPVAVEQRERTNLVSVSVRANDPVLAAAVATKVAYTFKTKDAERETEGAEKAQEDLARSIEKLRDTIATQEAELISVMKKGDLPLQDEGQKLSASRLEGLSQTWIKAMESRRLLEGRYNAAMAANNRGEGSSIPELTESAIYQQAVRLAAERRAKLQDDIRNIDKQIQTAETDLSELLVKYTEEHDEVKKKRERIQNLTVAREKTEKDVSSIIDRDKKAVDRDAVNGALVAMKSQLDSKRREESQAQAEYEKEAALANVQGVAMTELTTLKRGIETNRNLLDTYNQRLKEQDLAILNSSPDNIKITAEAIAPTTPVGPNRRRNIFIAFLISLAAGIGLAFLMDYLDDSVKTSDDIGRHLGLPTLALIPHHSLTEKRVKMSLMPKNGNNAQPATAMIALEERHSPMAEAYRHLRTSLLFSSAGKPPQTILVTSSQPSEGKTTTAINTAITLAQSDVDVILIDCDLRRPRLHSYFEMENTRGLTNYLSGEQDTEHLIKRCKGLPKLRVITSGPIPPNPAELLSSDEMKKLLQFLRGRYKHVIIDSPPAISFTDAAILSTQVDGVVLVAMAGKSSIHLMRRFKQRLGNIGARIYGVVLNGIKSSSVEYDYYGSGYYDYYGKSETDETPYFEEAGTSQNRER